MPLYDYDAPVSIPGPTLTTLRTELTNAAGTVAHATLANAFTKLADVGLPVNNRMLASVRNVREWARRNRPTYDALYNAADAAITQATGLP